MTVTNSLVNQPNKMPFQALIKSETVLNNISATLGSETRKKQFVSSVISAVSTNQALQACDGISIINAALLGEALNLSPSPQLGHYYMVPYKKKSKNENGDWIENHYATFQLGYKGYIQLAIRSGQYRKINVLDIKEGELISYNPLYEEIEVNLIQDELERENANTIGYYAMLETINGFRKAIYWSKEKMEAHADKYSQAFSLDAYSNLREGNIPEKDMWKYSSFWYKDFDAMAFKTMLRQLISKWGIMSIELRSAFDNDMSFKEEFNDKPKYFDNEKNEEIISEPIDNDKVSSSGDGFSTDGEI